jgi:hypothetical protein
MASEDFTAFNWDWLTDEDPDPFIQSYNTSRAILGEPYILPDPYVFANLFLMYRQPKFCR